MTVPGASTVSAAASIAGFPVEKFAFLGWWGLKVVKVVVTMVMLVVVVWSGKGPRKDTRKGMRPGMS